MNTIIFLNCKNYKLKNLKENFLNKTLEMNSCFSSLGKNDHVEKSPFDYLTYYIHDKITAI
jgi:hypothetical protein